jgi:hypothetical protein
MSENHIFKLNLYVRASMFTTDELRRQRRLALDDINIDVLNGLIQQKNYFEDRQNIMTRTLTISLFLAFVAWSGGNIKIPGTGASIGEVPAFLELSLISASFSVLMITYAFLSLQIYGAVISSIAQELLAKNELDTDIFVASKVPTWLFLKYAQFSPVNTRPPGYVISKMGALYNKILITSLLIVLLAGWVLAIISILYIAHTGLSNSIAGWSVYSFCIIIIFVSCISMSANIVEFEHKMDFDILEPIESGK